MKTKDYSVTCKRCERKLKSGKSIRLGYGNVCYKKKLLSENKRLGDFDNVN